MSPQKEDRITQLLTALERNGVLTIPSSRTQLILRLITFTVLTAITAIVSLAIATAPDNPAGRTTALIIGLLFIALFSTASAATYRQLTQKIQLTLTPQGMRLENESGGNTLAPRNHNRNLLPPDRRRDEASTRVPKHQPTWKESISLN